MTASRRARSYSHAYSKFVDHPEDLEGLIAYSLFKSAKVEKCRLYFRDNNVELSDEGAKNWSDEHSNDHFVRLYREQANRMMENYKDIIIERTKPLVRESVINSELGNFKSILDGMRGWRGVASNTCTGIFASIIFLGIGYLFIVANNYKPPWPFSEIQSPPSRATNSKPEKATQPLHEWASQKSGE